MIRDLYAHMPTPNYVKHLSPNVDAIEKYVISTMYEVPSDPTILAQHLKKHSDNKLEKKHSLTPLMQIKLPVHEKRFQLYTLPSNLMYQSQSSQPCVPIQSSLPHYQTQSQNAHPPSQESHLPFPALQQPRFDVFFGQLRDMKHQMSQMQQAQNLMLQNLMNNMWPTLPGQKTFHPIPLCLPN